MSSSLKRLLKVDIYDQFWRMVQLNHSKVKQEIQLSKDEAVSLYAYTLCHPPLYKELNSALRNGNSNNFIVKLIDSAIDTLPFYSGNFVYRWSNPTICEKSSLEGNETVIEKAYLSTLKAPNELTMAETDCMLLKIKQLNGRDITLYSDDFAPDIQEVLLPRNSVFKKSPNLDDNFDLILEQVG